MIGRFQRAYTHQWRRTTTCPKVGAEARIDKELMEGHGKKGMRYIYEAATNYSDFEEQKLQAFEEKMKTRNMEIPRE